MNLIFFTYNYPYVVDYSWKRNELEELKKHFKVTVIPFFPYSNTMLKNIPSGIEFQEPLLKYKIGGNYGQGFTSILSKRRFYYYKEFFRAKVYQKSSWVLEWLSAIQITEVILKHPTILSLCENREEENKNTILYFYWGVGTTLIAPFLRKAGFKKIIVRFHGFDLYEERAGGYLPFRYDLLKNVDSAILISEDGKKYLKMRYPMVNFYAKVYRLGAKKISDSITSNDGVLRILSCSHIIPVKRLNLIASALHNIIDIKIEWTHFGDGPSFEDLKKNTQNLPVNVQVNLPGRVSTDEIMQYYSDNPVDLFLNVSSSEGVPVSIMEAFSAGIPVYATNVGGTHEIVNDSNGKLLERNITPIELANELKLFFNFSKSKKMDFRKSAFETYETKCNFKKLNDEFIAFLKET